MTVPDRRKGGGRAVLFLPFGKGSGVSFLRRRPYAVFAAGVLVLTAAAFLAPLGRDLTPFVLVLVPALVAVAVSAVVAGGPGVRRLLARMLVWRVKPFWYVMALGIPVLEKLTVDLVGLVSGSTTPSRLVESLTVSAFGFRSSSCFQRCSRSWGGAGSRSRPHSTTGGPWSGPPWSPAS